mmetsp:Transcript_11356/g.31690  ORF Transcript_11356/g.31690 Transcript_11356/m.31690 type:complete len:218 (+) Transcript_11356:1575-2228(+)
MTFTLSKLVSLARATLVIGIWPLRQQMRRLAITCPSIAALVPRHSGALATRPFRRSGFAFSNQARWRMLLSSRRWCKRSQEVRAGLMPSEMTLRDTCTLVCVPSVTKSRRCISATPWMPHTRMGMPERVEVGITTVLASAWCLASSGSASPKRWKTTGAQARRAPTACTQERVSFPEPTVTMRPRRGTLCRCRRRLQLRATRCQADSDDLLVSSPRG